MQFGASVGDHRPAYIDINIRSLISKNRHYIVTAKARRLQVWNVTSLKNYLRYVEKEFRRNRMLERTEKLTQKLANGDRIDINKLEELDKLRISITLKG